jgi:hypothetical protein
MAQVILCSACAGTGFDLKTQRARCQTCGGSGLTKPTINLTRVTDDPKHWRNRAEEARSLAEGMRDEHTQSMLLRIAEGYDKIATMTGKKTKEAGQTNRDPPRLPPRGLGVGNAAHDITVGEVSVKHIPSFIGNVRDSLDALVAAGVERSALEQRLQRLEHAAANEDKGLIHETLVELKGFVTNSATKLVSTGVISLIDQILGFPSP